MDEYDLDGMEPVVKSVGYELRPDEMRPNVWIYEEGEKNNLHKHEDQEELYYVIKGSAVFEMGDDGDEMDVEEGDFVLVSKDEWRRVRAKERCVILVIGAPNVKNDEVVKER